MRKRVEHDGARGLQVRFPFDRALVDRIKELPNRRWNAGDRHWWVPEDDVVLLVDLLADDGFHFDGTTRELYVAGGGSRDLDLASRPAAAPDLPLFAFGDETADARPPVASGTPGDLTVAALNERVADLIAGAFPAPIWLVGEISGFNKSGHRRHVGFELVERSDDGRATAKVSAILFEGTRREIERALERAGGPFSLEDEITVRMQVRVDLYAAWGQYRVVVEQLDVHYTLGEAARRREEIVRALTAAGLLERNRGLPMPALPLRVGLITSLGSDAYNDVLRTLSESGFAFVVTAHGARVQGHATEPSVLNALDRFAACAAELDVVLICRGGGSRTDLVWFDTERLGRAVAEFPLPVVVGIGHEQDVSVLDAVARSCKTPTAAAALLTETVAEALEGCERFAVEILGAARRRISDERRSAAERGRRLRTATKGRLAANATRLAHYERQCVTASRVALGRARETWKRWIERIPHETTRRLAEARKALDVAVGAWTRGATKLRGAEVERLEARARRLHLVDPRRVLERGYAILRRTDRGVLLAADDARPGERLIAELKRGRLEVAAVEALPDGDGEKR